MKQDFTVVVPMLNEEGAAARVLNDLGAVREKIGLSSVVAVNDGSTDDTFAVLETLAATRPWLTVLSHENRRGYGAAIRTGIAKSSTRLVGWMDGDGQYHPEDFVLLRQEIDPAAEAATPARASKPSGAVSGSCSHPQLPINQTWWVDSVFS